MVRAAWSVEGFDEESRLRREDLLRNYESRGPEGTVILQRRNAKQVFLVDTGDRYAPDMAVVRVLDLGGGVLGPAATLGSTLNHDPYWEDYTGDEPEMLARVYDTLDDIPSYADLRQRKSAATGQRA